MVPFDAASEVPVEEQQAEAMVRIQDCLLAGQAPHQSTRPDRLQTQDSSGG